MSLCHYKGLLPKNNYNKFSKKYESKMKNLDHNHLVLQTNTIAVFHLLFFNF